MEKLGWNTKSENPGIIYCGSESQLDRAIEAKEKYKVPLFLNFWGWMPERFLILKWRVHYQKQAYLMDKYANFISVPTNLVAEQLYFLGVNRALFDIPAGIDTEKALSVYSTIDSPYLLSIGRLVPHKNFALAIKAIGRMNIKIPYVILGSGLEEKNLLKAAKESKVDLIILSRESDKSKFVHLKNALALIAPSRYEGFGMPIAEAATLSTPVIAYDLPSHRILFGDHLTYFQNVDELSSLLLRIRNNKLYRQQLGDKISSLGQKYSAFTVSVGLSRILSEKIAEEIKKNVSKGIDEKTLSVKQAYDIEAKLDISFFPYRLDPKIGDFTPRLNYLLSNAVGKKVLDVGSSNGVFSIHLAANDFEVYAIDISSEYLKNAKGVAEQYKVKDKIRFFQAEVTSLPFQNEWFDTVWAGEIIEHFTDTEPMISELIRVLKHGGRLIFSMPYKDACYDPLHYQIFNSKEDIAKLFQNHPEFELKDIEAKLGNNKNWLGYGIKK